MYDPYEYQATPVEDTAEEFPTEAPQPTAPVYEAPAPKKRRKKGLTGGKIVALALCCSLVGGAAGAGGMFLATRTVQPEMEEVTTAEEVEKQRDEAAISNMLLSQREAAVLESVAVETGELLTASEVYAQNVNSTVGITTSVTTNYFGYQTETPASGSGFVMTDDGYILTNYHVVENSNSIKVTTYDGTEYDAELIGYDESNDIAVLKIEAEGLVPVILGNSDALNVGDSVVAIGNPLGELTFSLTAGTVSALNRQVTFSTGTMMNLIQTDCAINSGNSGGALFNLYGEVIGITNAKYSSSSASSASIDNIGFAIPVNSVLSIVESIVENGYISKPYIGVSVGSVSAESQSYGLPQGAAIKEVATDSPAATAGLQTNDIITKANDTVITSSSDLVSYIGASKPGDVVTLTVYRQGETLELTLTIGEQIKSARAYEDAAEEAAEQQEQIPQQMPDSFFPFNFG